MKRPVAMLLILICGPAVRLHAEASCFRTALAAAEQAGVRDGDGFRLEGIRTDAFSKGSWAIVRSCPHPERPGVMVKMATVHGSLAVEMESRNERGAGLSAAVASGPLVHAGASVQMVRSERFARLQMVGVAQSNAAAGESVRVRFAQADGEAHFAIGLVRPDGVVEMEGNQ